MPFLGRDLFGQSTLYFAEAQGGVLTDSSALGLLARAGLPRRLDPTSVALALCGALPPERSLFHGVGRVPPGHRLVLGSGAPRFERGAPTPGPGSESDRERAADTVLRLLRQAVVKHAPGASCALSGGLDSSALIALAVESNYRPRALTLVTDYGDAGDLDRSRVLARAYRLEHVEICVREEDLPEHATSTFLACEDLLWNGAAVARHLFFREARRIGATALLSGVGADEVFCGHPEGLLARSRVLREERSIALDVLTVEAATTISARLRGGPETGGDLAAAWRDSLERVLPDSTLPPECRTARAEGVDIRLPYLDDDLAGAVTGLPLAWLASGNRGKLLLREALVGLLPDDVRLAPKVPQLAPGGGGHPRARSHWWSFYATWLAPERLSALGCVDPNRVRTYLDEWTRTESPGRRQALDAVLMRLASASVLALSAEP